MFVSGPYLGEHTLSDKTLVVLRDAVHCLEEKGTLMAGCGRVYGLPVGVSKRVISQ